jgi:AraC family transcriptional regulator, arabinose operon regulatory protein
LLVLPAKARRACRTDGEGPCSLIWIQLAAINMNALVAQLNVAPQMTNLGTGEKMQVLALFQEVMQALEMPCPERLLQVSQMALHLLANSIPSPREGCQVQTAVSAKIGQTIEFMKEHLNEPLRAATLAGVAKMSLPHYFALFKRVVGSSPIDYLIKLRMKHAQRLLADTSWSVKEVAVSLGYDDPLYFSRVFKSINQTAPSNFRARKRSANDR